MSPEDELACPDCAMRDAMPWVALAVAWAAGTVLTAGWVLRAAWHAARDPDALRWLLR